MMGSQNFSTIGDRSIRPIDREHASHRCFSATPVQGPDPNNKNMKTISTALFASFFAMTTSCFAANSSSPAEELVRAARFDFAIVDALQYSKGRSFFEVTQYESLAPCISARGAALITPILANRIAESMNEDDIRAALQFYKSPPGKKFTEASLIAVHHEHQIEMEKDLPAISPEEESVITKFMASPIRQKITNSITDRTAVFNAAKREILRACAAE